MDNFKSKRIKGHDSEVEELKTTKNSRMYKKIFYLNP